METVFGLVPGLAGELVESLVLLVVDFALVLEPQGLDFVDALLAEKNREADEVAVGLDEVLEAVFAGEVSFIFFKVNHELGSPLQTFCGFDLVASLAVTGPDVAGLVGTPGA